MRYSRPLALLILAGTLGRILYVDRPFDHRSLVPWREADYVQIARNFQREGMNVLYPRIDWRGDTRGYAEMEFPALPWLGALLFRVFAYHEPLLRVLSALLSVASLLLFGHLSWRLLPPVGALFAVAAFALNPLLVILGSAMQPEPLMLLLSLAAITLIWRWQQRTTFAALLAASAATAGAILAKTPAAYLGLVFAYSVLRTRGVRAFWDARIYVAAVVAILPPLAWYLWSVRFWWTYGNSLGLSNESHFIGLDMFWPPRFVYGLLKLETVGVFTPAGWILAAVALQRPRMIEPVLVWLAAVWAFYLVTARTSADDWAFYYHCHSVAPACLLMGAGAAAFARGDALPASLGWLARQQRWLGGLCAAATVLGCIAASAYLIQRRDSNAYGLAMRTCAQQFLPHVPPLELIVAQGGTMVDEYGKPVAHNESMLFAWMDRKGFNYGTQELSLETLERIAKRGGRYWIVQRDELKAKDLQSQVDARYRRIADCSAGYSLYDLRRGSR